jgi:tRNA splicing endonuclease
MFYGLCPFFGILCTALSDSECCTPSSDRFCLLITFFLSPGDPIKFHAQFLVVCMDDSGALPATDLVALGRLGTSVRKTVVLSYLSDDGNTVKYQSLQWNASF